MTFLVSLWFGYAKYTDFMLFDPNASPLAPSLKCACVNLFSFLLSASRKKCCVYLTWLFTYRIFIYFFSFVWATHIAIKNTSLN